MNAFEATVAYLTTSTLSLIWQSITLRRLVRDSSLHSRATDAYRGLRRTAACRVIVSIAYVLVGINAIWPRLEVLIATFVVYSATLALWQANSWLDLRLAKRLRGPRPAARRRASR